MTIADSVERAKALDPSRSFAVAAPAGSGKTELLTQRVLKLLSIVDEPEEILCMTFTRKAAGEMQHRIMNALENASKAQTTPPKGLEDTNTQQESHQQTTFNLAQAALKRDKERHWQLLNNPSRLRIQTIDGFCLNLAQQLAVESQFGDYSEPLDDPTPVYREAIAELLLPALEQKNDLGQAIATLLHHLDNDLNKLELLLINLLSKREQWLGQLFQSRGARGYLENFLDQVIEETLHEAKDRLIFWSNDLAILADYAASQLSNSKRHSTINHCLGLSTLPEPKACDLPQWQGLCELLLTAKDEWRKRLDKNCGFPTETFTGGTTEERKKLAKAQKETMSTLLGHLQSIPGLLDQLQDIRYLPSAQYDDNQWQVLDALTLLLPSLSAQLSLAFQKQKVCDFTEITLAALRSLGPEDMPTDLALKLDYRISHILTDEFQDTSSVQFDLLKRITAGWQSGDGRSLFIVGDAMQSLYGFRSANVGLFLEARNLPLGNIQLEPLDLQVNFRSQEGIIKWVNQAFEAVFPARDNISRGAVSYSPAIAYHPAIANQSVTVDAFVDYPDSKAEAKHVVSLVNNAKHNDPEGSIAILVRNRTHLTEILIALQQAEHRWQATDIDPLGKRMPVIDLMSLTRALLSPADRIAWLSILRAPWCGLDLTDLFHITNHKLVDKNPLPDGEHYPLLLLNICHYSQITGLSNEGKKILSRVSNILQRGWEQRYRKPFRTWVEGIWIALGGIASLRSDSELNHCQQYCALLEKHEKYGRIDNWSIFEKAVQSLYAKPDEHADPRLHVMTIHKSKGLEFDTVIIPALNRKPRGDDKQLMLWQERVGQQGQNQLIIGPLERTGQDSDPLFKYLQREQKLKGKLEKARVLYVGATRAIKQLHLTYSIGKDKKPTANSLLESLLPALESISSHESTFTLKIHDDQSNNDEIVQTPPVLQALYRLPSDWQEQSPLLNSIGNQTITTTYNNQEQQTLGESLTALNTEARHTGTVLHRILRQMVIEGADNWNNKRIIGQLPFWKVQLQHLGLTKFDEPLALLQRAVTNCLEDESALWLLNHQHQESQCEYGIGYLSHTGEAKTAVVDRCFVSEGIQWIIDYKTAEPSEGESQDSFLNREISQYRSQLEHYAELFKQIHHRPTKIALYFPLFRHLAIL
jgi:ATP-dependent exoDNAse (exonuclease V) beta subunit